MEIPAIKEFYSNRDGLVTMEDDVLSIVAQIREKYGDRIRIAWEPTTESFVLSEYCTDGTERLIFTTPELDGRVLDRLMRADSQSRTYQDPYDAAERAQDDAQREIDARYTEYIGEASAHLVHDFKKEGLEPRLPLTVAIPKDVSNADSDR